MAQSDHNASESMVGYLYQCREALLLAIEETKSFPNLFVSIERFDDVAFDKDGTPLTQLQLKHHTQAGNLNDASPDLWKTLRIWSAQVGADPKVALERRFLLLTTGTAPEGSIAALLRHPRPTKDAESKALARLETVAKTSTNKKTAEAREAFLELLDEDKNNLISSIHIRDQSPTIVNVRSEIEERLAFATPQDHVPHLVDHLEGWWFSQIVESLSKVGGGSISLLALRQKVDEIAVSYKTGQLLLNDDVNWVSEADLHASEKRVFVQQLRCVDIAETSIDFAKRDYYRATAQRSAWARENVLLDGEARRYDEELVDRWQRERQAREAVALPQSEDDKRAFGRELFHWASRSQLPFRNRHEMWLCSGSYQILADTVSVGWHPDHQTLFNASSQNVAA